MATAPGKPPAQPRDPPQADPEDVLRRMLNTPPKPHTDMTAPKPPAKKPRKK